MYRHSELDGLDPLDAAAIAAARGGSPAALTQIIEACRGYLLLMADRELNRDIRAKAGPSDVVQETLMKAHQQFASFRGAQEGELLAWLRTILLHEIGMLRRRFESAQKRDARLERPLHADDAEAQGLTVVAAPGPTPSRHAVANEQAVQIERLLARLPDDYQQVIRLRYWQHLSLAEVGARMQRTPEAARKLWARAVDRLAAEWEQVYGAEEQPA